MYTYIYTPNWTGENKVWLYTWDKYAGLQQDYNIPLRIFRINGDL